MRSFTRVILITSAINMLMVGSVAAQETGMTRLERELDYIMRIWPGDYNNQEQLSLDATAKGEQQKDQPHFHILIKKVDAPSLGENVLYAEEQENANPDRLYQQRVYVLSPDENEKAVRVAIYALKDGEKFLSAKGYDRAPVKLGKQVVNRMEGCDILVRRDGYKFRGAMQSKSCNDSGEGYFERRISFSEDQYSFQDRRVDDAGEVLSSVADFAPREMRRARWFACMIDVPKDTPNTPNHTQHYIKIHDQGGVFQFTHPDGRKMNLLMRNTWSYGMQRDTFVIVVQEDASGKTLVYAWGEPDSDRIGVNPGYIRVQCDLDSPQNVKLQEGLRAES